MGSLLQCEKILQIDVRPHELVSWGVRGRSRSVSQGLYDLKGLAKQAGPPHDDPQKADSTDSRRPALPLLATNL